MKTPPARPRGPRVGRLSELAPEDRPREKLLGRGASSLSDEELLAIILGTGRAGRPVLEISRDLLSPGGFPGLFRQGEGSLKALVRGIGDAKAARLAAVLEVSRRIARADAAAPASVSDPLAACAYLKTALASETREVMGALLLDAKNRLLKDARVFEGTATHTSVSPSPLFRQAILAGAVGLVLYHNHPSGDPSPSPEDRVTTERFTTAGRAIGIEVRDHLVVGRGVCYSFRSGGLL